MIAEADSDGESPIVQVGDKVLRQRAAEIPLDEISGAAIKDLIAQPGDALVKVPGVGIAAPQIGVHYAS